MTVASGGRRPLEVTASIPLTPAYPQRFCGQEVLVSATGPPARPLRTYESASSRSSLHLRLQPARECPLLRRRVPQREGERVRRGDSHHYNHHHARQEPFLAGARRHLLPGHRRLPHMRGDAAQSHRVRPEDPSTRSSIVRVSMETLDIVESLSPLDELPQTENWPIEWGQ